MKFDDMLKLVVKSDIKVGKIPMLLGEPGIGKSSWCEWLVETELRGKLFTLACNQLADKADLTGARLVPTEDGSSYKQIFYPHAVIQDAVIFAKNNPRMTVVLLMDELNRTTPDVTSELLSIPTTRSIGATKLPSNLKIITAGNDHGNVTALDEASISRFVLYHVEPDVETFLSLDDNLNPFVRAVLEKNPSTLFCKTLHDETHSDDDNDTYIDDEFDIDDGMHQFTTPRTISGLSDWLNTFDNNDIKLMLATPVTNPDPNGPQSFLQESIEGHVGHTQFSILLMNEIQQNLARVNNKRGEKTMEKPDGYDSLRSSSTIDEMATRAKSYSPSDLFGMLVYAMYDKQDNSTLIQVISPMADNPTASDVNTLMELNLADNLDDENVRAFLNSNSDLVTRLEVLLNRGDI